MYSGNNALCRDCAERLGKKTWPEVPELIDGYCPQCGGVVPLEPLRSVVPFEWGLVAGPDRVDLEAA